MSGERLDGSALQNISCRLDSLYTPGPFKGRLHKCPGSLSLASTSHQFPSYLTHLTSLVSKTQCYVQTGTLEPTHFAPEDRGSMYLRNFGNITDIHMG
jgi:hypothetical protein